MPEPRDGTAADRALDRFWDGITAGSGPALVLGAPDPADAAAVRRFHALPDAPPPAPSFVARLEEELMRPHAIPHVAQPTRLRATNGATTAARSLPAPPPVRRPSTRRLWWRASEGLAAAVLLLAIAAGLATGWGLLPNRDDGQGPTAPSGLGQAATGAAVAPGAAMERGNAARTGEVVGPGPTDEPELRWRVQIAAGENGGFYGPPVVVDGVAYLAGRLFPDETEEGPGTGYVLAVDLVTRKELWRAPVVDAGAVGDYIDVGRLAVGGGLVYVGTVVSTPVAEIPQLDPATGEESGVVVQAEPSAALVALDARSGAERWRVPTGKDNLPSPAASDGVVYVPVEGALLALDGATGAERWRFALAPTDPAVADGVWFGPPAVGDGMVYATDRGGVVHALDARSGAERWRFPRDGRWLGDPVVADGRVYVWSDADADADADAETRAAAKWPTGVLVALDAADGTERWRHAGADAGRPPTVGAGSVFLSGRPGDETTVVALDPATGRERWTATVDGYGADDPVLANGVLYFGTFQDGLLPVTDFGGLFGLGDRNFLHALDAASGRQLWRKQIDPFASAPAIAGGVAYLVAAGDDGDAGTLHAYGGG